MTSPSIEISPEMPPQSANATPRRTIAEAKANLLAWAEESSKPSKSGLPRTALVIGGGIAALFGGLMLSRFLGGKPATPKIAEPATPVGKRVIGLLIAAKIAKWVLPIVLSAVTAHGPPKPQSK